MSLEFNAVGDYARVTSANALGDGSNPTYEGTLMAWYYHQSSSAGAEIMRVGGGAGICYMRVASSTSLELYQGAQRATWTVAQNTWYFLYLSNSANTGNVIGRVFADAGGGEISVASGSNTYAAGGYGPVSSIAFGNDNAWGDSAVGLYRYARWWRSVISQADALTESSFLPSSGSPASQTTLLRGSWGLPDGTTATDWVSGGIGNITINSGSTSATEPSIGGGSSPVLSAATPSAQRNRRHTGRRF